ncbi:MAG: hypothetical protein Q9221_007220 [Calogaya cf. arnoldii]
MSHRPIILMTYPRSLSTAVERVFMTCPDTITTFHEPFGDAFYWGPERSSPRSENDGKAKEGAGFEECTYAAVLGRILEAAEEKRVFIKDLAFHILPLPGHAASFPPSIISTNGTLTETGNPTLLPLHILRKFQFAFLIRHPRYSIPSLYKMSVPPLNAQTGWDTFLESEIGLLQLRRLFDFLYAEGGVAEIEDRICLLDADDLLDNPSGILKSFCALNNLDFSDEMLTWDTHEQQEFARRRFEKWKGFHEDVLGSRGFEKRDPVS